MLIKTLFSAAILASMVTASIMAMTQERPKEMSNEDKEAAHKMMLFNQGLKEATKGELHEDEVKAFSKSQIAPLLHAVSHICPIINKLGDIQDILKNVPRQDKGYTFIFNSKTYFTVNYNRILILKHPPESKIKLLNENTSNNDDSHKKTICKYEIDIVGKKPQFTISYEHPATVPDKPAAIK